MNNSLIDISIVLPVYNMAIFLRQAIDSVLSQSCNSIEIIIVDDASTDDSFLIIDEYVARYSNIKAIYLPENSGSGFARNIGLDAANGRYIRFLDPDDYYPEGSLEKMLDFANLHDADIVVGNIASHNNQTGKVYPKEKNTWINSEGYGTVIDNPSFWVPLHHHRFLFKRVFLIENNIIYPNLRRGQDPVMLAKALAFSKDIYFIESIVYIHRVFPQGRTRLSAKSVTDLIEHFSLVIDVYTKRKWVKFAYLHLLNRANIILHINFGLYSGDELVLIISNLHTLLSKINWFNLCTYNYSPYNRFIAIFNALLLYILYKTICFSYKKFPKNRWLLNIVSSLYIIIFKIQRLIKRLVLNH